MCCSGSLLHPVTAQCAALPQAARPQIQRVRFRSDPHVRICQFGARLRRQHRFADEFAYFGKIVGERYLPGITSR